MISTSRGEETPPQDVLRKACLRPGRNVDIVVAQDLDRDLIDIRTSTIHQIDDDGGLVLAQTSPPLGPSARGRLLEISFLARFFDQPGGRWLRVGYRGRLREVAGGFRLAGGSVEQVLLVDGPQSLEKHNLRLYFRLEPTGDQNLVLYLLPTRTAVPIVDISVGGVRFSHDPDREFPRGKRLKLALVSDAFELLVDGRVVVSHAQGTKDRPAPTHTAVQFTSLDMGGKQALGKYLNDLLRLQLARRSGLDRE